MQKKISLLFCTVFIASVLMAQNGKQQPPPPPPPVEKEAPPAPEKEHVDMLQKKGAIENMYWSESGKKLHIWYKDGRTEVYNLETNVGGGKILSEGKIPPPPPPIAN